MFKISELVKLIDGEYKGKISEIVGLAPFESAKENEITFAADEKFLKNLDKTKAKLVIVPPIQGLPTSKEYIYVNKSPRELMPLILNFFKRKTKMFIKNIEDSSKISENVQIGFNSYIGHDTEIGENVTIYPNVTILEGVKIGKNSIIYPNVVIREFCEIGENVILQPGCVIGSDGFGYVKVNDKNFKIEQIGKVLIESDVEIGANVTIDRGTIGDTIIKKNTKIDNLVHIAHNVEIGESGLIVAQVGIAGSTIVGNSVTIGGQAGIVGHIKIEDNVTIASRAGVTNNLENGKIVSGFPAINHSDDLKNKVLIKKLPEFSKRIKELEKIIKKGE